jgi:hypothetical protein
MKHHDVLNEMKVVASLFVFAGALCGCSTTYPVRSRACEEMNEEFKEEQATIELADGREIPAKYVRVFDDSVSWIEPETNYKSRAAHDQINRIVVKNHSLGTLEGLGIGLAGGIGLGALLGSVFTSSATSSSLGSGFGPAVGGLLGGGAGIFVGLLAGGIIGHSYNYEFRESVRIDSDEKGTGEKSTPKVEELDRHPLY